MNHRNQLLFLIILASLLNSNTILAQKNEKDKIYTIVEEMPYLKICDEIGLKYEEKKACSNNKILGHIFENLTLDSTDVYYSECCNSIVSFIINKKGKVRNIEILKSINSGFDSRIVEIIKKFPDFIPGKQKGEPVNVKINLPIKIKPNFK